MVYESPLYRIRLVEVPWTRAPWSPLFASELDVHGVLVLTDYQERNENFAINVMREIGTHSPFVKRTLCIVQKNYRYNPSARLMSYAAGVPTFRYSCWEDPSGHTARVLAEIAIGVRE